MTNVHYTVLCNKVIILQEHVIVFDDNMRMNSRDGTVLYVVADVTVAQLLYI